MTDVEVKDGHRIRAPGHQTFPMETPAGMGDPDLFAQRLGNRCFRVTGFSGRCL